MHCRRQVKALEAEIAAQLAAHPDAHIFTCLPRAGHTARGPAARRDRRLPGPVPRPRVAGRPGRASPRSPAGPASTSSVAFRWAVNRQLRDAVCDFAGDSRHASPWAAAIYDAARARGKDHPHAVRILARAWLYVIWRCWQDGTAYDPAKHNALQRILDQQHAAAAAPPPAPGRKGPGDRRDSPPRCAPAPPGSTPTRPAPSCSSATDCFLRRRDFAGFVHAGTSITDGVTPMAWIDWDAAISALHAGQLPASGGERRILQLAASIAAGTPVSLRDTIPGLDNRNLQLLHHRHPARGRTTTTAPLTPTPAQRFRPRQQPGGA